ncbi:membrane integrity-associated transporter subunit PqiC [Affinibrenneria salicis]|uniref:Membrane integrity-associated transporter subunit PqiC n=1 Tax=Affinibrenneria salicis TaxID=2590031 RepID=A0A5J5G3E1_9GAMM|nr:PqiC family protein [Affinibrenneria salicis]KAA9001346.1 membrane integrity-associated transporter subunit PqiC [Affinibrenneria salicis]
MKRSFNALVVSGALLGLAACASPQIAYHTLVSPTPPVGAFPADAPFVIDVLPVGVPAQLDMSQVVVRQDNSRVAVLDNDRWLSPLGDELHTALASQIAHQSGAQDISGLVRTEGTPAIRILIQIRRFDSWPGNAVSLDADWTLSTKRDGRRVSLLCSSRLTQRAAGDYTQIFPAWQDVLTQMSAQIAQTARRWSENTAAPCPN